MTLEEIENSLPNGLHDAQIKRLAVDYEQRTLTMEVAVWVGKLDGPKENWEEYRAGRIEITGLVFLIMEPPDVKYPFRNSAKLTIDGCDLRQNLDSELLRSLPQESFFRSLWVGEWNGFIHVAGTAAIFSWLDKVSAIEGAKS
jgi:hypothetical protein